MTRKSSTRPSAATSATRGSRWTTPATDRPRCAIKACEYDLALIDLVMPGMDCSAVACGGRGAWAANAAEQAGLAVLRKAVEIRPEMPTVIITGHPDVDTAVAALRLGAADYLGKPIKFAELEVVLQRATHLRTLRHEKRHVPKAARKIPPPAHPGACLGELVGDSPATNEVRRQIREAVEAGCEMVLITGETGTGKDVTARAIHAQAAAAGDPFVAVSCPAFADSLLESELFGHVKGAFTGATEERAGCFEQANGGTIFLDEAGDLSLPAQAKILRVLETRSLRRVGGAEEISVQVRAIAATNAPLEELVQSGRFRRDLFYRLNAYAIHLSPLRQRRADILPLAEHFLASYAATKGLSLEGFDADAADRLRAYDFPGNARELRYLVQRAAMFCRSGRIRAEHLALPAKSGPSRPAPSTSPSSEEQERILLLGALEAARWNCRQAAQQLGIPYSTFRYKMSRLGIRK